MKKIISFCRIICFLTLLLFCHHLFALDAPKIIKAEALAENKIRLSWQPGVKQLNYMVERSANQKDWLLVKTFNATATSFTNGGLKPSTTYYFRVFAIEGKDTSASSKIVSAKTYAIPALMVHEKKMKQLNSKIIYKTESPNVRKIVSDANNLLYDYTDEEWLALVPIQGARDNVFSPQTGSNKNWAWSPKNPNIISDGVNFYDYYKPTKYKEVKVLSGRIVKAPLWDGAKGTNRLVGGQINQEKLNFLHRNLDRLAQAYEVTGDEKYAHRVAITLDSLAKCVPHYFITNKNNDKIWLPEEALASGEDFQRCSNHNGVAHELNDDIIFPYDKIRFADTLQVLSKQYGYDVAQHIEKNLYQNILSYIKDFFPYKWHLRTNIPFHIANAQKVANILNDAEFTKWNYQYSDSCINLNIMSDGVCPESFSYGYNYLRNNIRAVQELKFYIDLYPNQPEIQPIKAEIQRIDYFYNWAVNQAIQVAYPTGQFPPLDNTYHNVIDDAVRNSTKTKVLPSFGHVMLGDGEKDLQVQWNQHFPGGANHVDATGNASILYAFGEELSGSIRYYRQPGRNWAQSTMSHNTVTINQQNQEKSYVNHPQNHGEFFLNGVLSFLEANNHGVSVVESDAVNRYIQISDVKEYKRLAILNTVDIEHPYVIDLFKVKGGHTHDYFLHGSTSFDQKTEVKGINLMPLPGKHPLLAQQSSWKEPTTMGSDTDWYGIFRNVKSAKAKASFDISFKGEQKKGMRIWLTNRNEGYDIFTLESPSPTRLKEVASLYKYYRPGILLRHQKKQDQDHLESLFAAVIEPLNGDSFIDSVRHIALKVPQPNHIALAVYLKNKRIDVWLVNLSAVDTQSNLAEPIETLDGNFSLRGKIGYFSNQSTNLLLAGTSMKYRNYKLELDQSAYKGSIQSVQSKAKGHPEHAFVTNVDLPVGDELSGRWLSLNFGDYPNIPVNGKYKFNVKEQKGMSQIYQIKNIEKRDGKTYINLHQDHQLMMNQGHIEEIMRPHRKFTGPNQFSITKQKFDATLLNLEF